MSDSKNEFADIRNEFDAAVAVARQALEQFQHEPLVSSKRGGDRLSCWWKVYREASEVAVRWHRRLQAEPEPSVDDVINSILGEGAG